MIRKACVIFIFCLILKPLSAQLPKPNAETALQLFKAGEFGLALEHYAQLYNQYSKDPKYNFYYGACLVETNQQISLASKCLKFASLKNINKESFFYLARAYQLSYEFEEAITNYVKFTKVPAISGHLKERSQTYINECKVGVSMVPKIYDISVISTDTVTATAAQGYPVSPDAGKIMKNSDFFESGIDPNGVLFVTERGDQVYYADKQQDAPNSDLFKMEHLVDGWSKPQNLGSGINSSYDEKFAFLMTDGVTLYFSSNRPGGLGGFDIYKASYNNENKQFGDAINMGIPFNSPLDDYFLAPDDFGRTAWFTSNRATTSDKSVIYCIKWDGTLVKNNVADITQVKEAAFLKIDNNQQAAQTTRTNNLVKPQKDNALFHFQIADTLEYTQLSHFRSDEALAEFKQGRLLEQKKDSLTLLMKDKRARYAATRSETERNTMVNDILRLEKETYSLDAAIEKHYYNAQRLELEKIKELVRTGRYVRQEGTKIQPKNNFSFDLKNIPKDLTLYSADDFGQQLEALQTLYPRLFPADKAYRLQQADSLYAWGNLLNIESSRMLEKASKTPSPQEIQIPRPFKHAEPEPVSGQQLIKDAREIKYKALRLYHQSLDLKYTIYRAKYEEISGQNNSSPTQKQNSEAYTYYREAKAIEEDELLQPNPERYEKAGALKRKAVEAQEKGLFAYLESSSENTPPSATKKPDGFVMQPYSGIHKNETPAPSQPVTPAKKQQPVAPPQKPLANAQPSNKAIAPAPNAVVYKVQIGVFRNKPDEQALQKLDNVSTEYLPENGLTKYYSGNYHSYEQAATKQATVRENGFANAFIVAFANGKQITLQQARDIGQKK